MKLVLVFLISALTVTAAAEGPSKVYWAEYGPLFEIDKGVWRHPIKIYMSAEDISRLKPNAIILLQDKQGYKCIEYLGTQVDENGKPQARFGQLKKIPTSKDGKPVFDPNVFRQSSGGAAPGSSSGSKGSGSGGGPSVGAAGSAALQRGIAVWIFENVVMTGRDRAEIGKLNQKIGHEFGKLRKMEIDINQAVTNINNIVKDANQKFAARGKSDIESYLKQHDPYKIQTTDPQLRSEIALTRNAAINIEPVDLNGARARNLALKLTEYADELIGIGEGPFAASVVQLARDTADLALGFNPRIAAAKGLFEYVNNVSLIDGHTLAAWERASAVIDIMSLGHSGKFTGPAKFLIRVKGLVENMAKVVGMTEGFAFGTPAPAPGYMDVVMDHWTKTQEPRRFLTSAQELNNHLTRPPQVPRFDSLDLRDKTLRHYREAPGAVNGSTAALLRRDRLFKNLTPDQEMSLPSYKRAANALQEIKSYIMQPQTRHDRVILEYMYKDIEQAMNAPLFVEIPEPPGLVVLPGVQN